VEEVQEQDPWRSQQSLLVSSSGPQRKLAQLSLRELAGMTKVSNAYLSQVERSLHQPSVRVLVDVRADHACKARTPRR